MKNDFNKNILIKDDVMKDEKFRIFIKEDYNIDTFSESTLKDLIKSKFSFYEEISKLKYDAGKLSQLIPNLNQIINNPEIFDQIFIDEANSILLDF